MAKSAASAFAILVLVQAAVVIQAGVMGAPPGTTRFDPAVVPAGGVLGHPSDGAGCRREGCRHHGKHHADCRNGRCVPYCPVRPAEFGYYGTHWRRWPSDVVPVSGIEDATPAVPPRLEIPGPDEESPRMPELDSDQTGGGSEAGADPADRAPEFDPGFVPEAAPPAAEETRLPSEPRSVDPPPAAPSSDDDPTDDSTPTAPPADDRPPAEPPAADAPAAKPPAVAPPNTEPPANLFDDASARGWRKFLKPAVDPQPAESTPPTVAPVRFDQLEEVRAAASARGRKISVATPK